MKRFISLLIALTMLAGILCGCAAKPAEDTLHITFRVTHDDGELKEFELETAKSTLAEVLIDNNLVKESAESSGFYDTVDGEVADWNDNEGWWCFSCNGEALMVGIEETQLIDGAVYDAVFTHGFG